MLQKVIKSNLLCYQVFNPVTGLCDQQKNVAGCEDTYPEEPQDLDIEVCRRLSLFRQG
jgi:hypothetical protein